ncbi:Oxidative stress 3 [Quillaja saponaria]|uniref:Oxidative stress 3 n=1 Tax=Quillaja saponaria TaxID=32244 RepID=A0AAD7M049_QUISA|nr:Oxidative stress 3 [Quillaja saponaria]
MEQEIENMRLFDMGSLRKNLPQNRRGLSRYYSGKARSFTCVADAQCVEDLKKPEHPDAKKRKKYLDQKEFHNLPSYPCRRVSSSSQFGTLCVGV